MRTFSASSWLLLGLCGLAILACEGSGADSGSDSQGPGSDGGIGSGAKNSSGGSGTKASGGTATGGQNPSGGTGSGGLGGEAQGDGGSFGGDLLPGSGGDSGGSGADSGGTGAGGSGSGGGATGPGCEGKHYLICEDFESVAPGDIPDGWTRHGSESGVTDLLANSGTRSLELGAIPVWERRIYRDASVLGSSHWGRIFYRVAQPVPDAFVHSTLVAFAGIGPTVGAAEYRVVDTVKREVDFVVDDQAGKYQFLYNVQISGGPEFGEGTNFVYWFEDAWHCAEWYLDAEEQAYAFYLDGDEVISFARGAGNYEDAEIPESFSEIKIGWINYQESPPGFTAWLDDLAVDDERVGCGL